MKFTKEDARKELTAKLTPSVENISKWERTITENIETLWNLLGEESEIELADFTNKALPLFNTTAGFIRKENSDLAKSYEDKIKNLSKEPTQQPNDDVLKRLEELEAKNKLAEQKVLIEETKSKILSKMGELGIKDNSVSNKIISMISIDEKSDVDATANKCLELYNSIKANDSGYTTPQSPTTPQMDYASKTIEDAAALAKAQRL